MASHENLSSIHPEDWDIFDALPKHLVSQILSYLPTNDAIKTSILSKRWRLRWTTISNLDFWDGKLFDPSIFKEDGDTTYEEIESDARIKRFTDHVNKVLLQHEPNSIDKFSIRLNECPVCPQFEKWISVAVKHNVKDLILSAQSLIDPIDLPKEVFNCKSLEALSLYKGVSLNIQMQGFLCFSNLKFLSLYGVSISGIPAKQNLVCFPKLKTLHLRNVSFVGKDECVMKLIRQCLVLEYLSIGRVIEHNVSNIDMCIPELRHVELCFRDRGTKVEIEAPINHIGIMYLDPTHRVFVKNASSLITAEIMMIDPITENFEPEQKDNVSKLMKNFEKVKCLKLRYFTATVIRASQIELPLFCNLTHLEVVLICKNLCVLHCLLNNSYNLQSLIIFKRAFRPCCIEDEQWMEFSDVPKCLLTSLKRVEIHGFDGCRHRLDMIKNILKCAETLKKLTIKCRSMNDGDISTLRQKISTFPRASAACVVDFFIFVTRFGSYFW